MKYPPINFIVRFTMYDIMNLFHSISNLSDKWKTKLHDYGKNSKSSRTVHQYGKTIVSEKLEIEHIENNH